MDHITFIDPKSCMAVRSDERTNHSKIRTSTIKTAATYFVLSHRDKSGRYIW